MTVTIAAEYVLLQNPGCALRETMNCDAEPSDRGSARIAAGLH